MIRTKDVREWHKPCESPFCPKHAWKSRENWVRRIEYECKQYEHNYAVFLPFNKWLDKEQMTKQWKSFKNAIEYGLPKHKYCYVIEVQNDLPHMHGFIHSHHQVSEEKIKQCWKKMLRRHFQDCQEPVKSCVRGVWSAKGIAEYSLKGSGAVECQLPPRGWVRSLVKASRGYGYPETIKVDGKRRKYVSKNVNSLGN